MSHNEGMQARMRFKDSRATHRPTLSIGSSTVFLLTCAWTLLLVFLCLHKNWRYTYDDAYITFRYARHLIEGLGPKWNRTGAPVEGFSSPLHLLLIALLGKIGMGLIAAARLLSFTSHLILVVFVWRFVAKTESQFAGLLAGALIATSWPMLAWDLGGLDEVLFAAASTIAVLVTLRYIETGKLSDLIQGGLLLGLAVLVRPDGALFAIVSLGTCLILGPGSIKRRVSHVGLAACLAVLIVMPWEIFRLAYYHAVLPNTYYAKVDGVPLGWRVRCGLEYWLEFGRKPPYFPLVTFVIAVGVLLKRRATRFDIGLWACIIMYSIYIVTSGGDHMMAFRFMIPIIPLMAISIARGLNQWGALDTPPLAAAVSLTFFLLSLYQIVPTVENPSEPDISGVVGRQDAEYMSSHWPSGSTVGIDTAGTTAYYADQFNFIDMLGLNDRVIARRNPNPMYPTSVRKVGHMKGDGASVLARRPDFIIAALPSGRVLSTDDPLPYYITEYELIRSSDFPKIYEVCEVTIPMSDEALRIRPLLPQKFPFIYYQRRDIQLPCAPPL
jgi:arabinofuranosyltransferase